jgi:hypothetical protein
MFAENFDPKEKPEKNEDPGENGDPQESNEDTEEFPDLYSDDDEDFNDPDEQEFI